MSSLLLCSEWFHYIFLLLSTLLFQVYVFFALINILFLGLIPCLAVHILLLILPISSPHFWYPSNNILATYRQTWLIESKMTVFVITSLKKSYHFWIRKLSDSFSHHCGVRWYQRSFVKSILHSPLILQLIHFTHHFAHFMFRNV